MKTVVLVENLKKGLGMVLKAVSNKPQLPVLSGVMIESVDEGLELRATDLEMSLIVKLGAKVEEKGSIVVPARLFGELVASLDAGPVELFVEKQVLKISGGGVNTEIVGQSADEFPVLVRAKGKGAIVDGVEFCKKVNRVATSAAKDDTRPVLTGIYWVGDGDKVSLVATDGYRLGLEKITVSEEDKVDRMILPARALMEWSRIVNDAGAKKIVVELDKENQQVIMGIDGVEMSSRLIAGEFPPYKQIIPSSYKTRVILKRQEMLDAVKRASLFARENANVVKIEIDDKKMVVRAESSQLGSNSTEINLDGEGENVVTAFNARYLIEYLGAINEEEVVMETEGELKPGVFKMLTGDFLQLVMPIRV